MSNNAPRLDLNPSSADRWMACTASPQFILENWDKLPPHDTAYNQEGTTAHEVAAACLEGRQPRADDKYYCPTPITPEMRWHGWQYAEYVMDIYNAGNGVYGKLLVEQKLPLFYRQERNAIVDAAIISQDYLHIFDYKYGEGVVVSPEKSLQAAIYAKCVLQANPIAGAPRPHDFPVTIHIYQPRGRAANDSPFHIWETTAGEIQMMSEKISKLARWIVNVNERPAVGWTPQFAPSEKACQWCPAKGFCAARQEHLTRDIETLAVIDDSPKHYLPAKAISVKQLCAILKHKDQIVRWLNDAETYALEHMKAGGSLPGYKLVMSRGGNRYWSNPHQAAHLLLKTTVLRKDEVIEEKVITVAAAEKLLGKQKFGMELTNLIAKPPGSPVIAPEDDKREACLVDGKTEFEVL